MVRQDLPWCAAMTSRMPGFISIFNPLLGVDSIFEKLYDTRITNPWIICYLPLQPQHHTQSPINCLGFVDTQVLNRENQMTWCRCWILLGSFCALQVGTPRKANSWEEKEEETQQVILFLLNGLSVDSCSHYRLNLELSLP